MDRVDPQHGPIRVAVIGCGYWGPNFVRNFSVLEEFELAGVADLDPARLESVSRRFPVETTTTDAGKLLEDTSIEAVAIATPISSHAELARRSLEAGKHVIIEKPMAHTVEACQELIDIARDRERVLLVDHTYIYHGAVEAIRRQLDEKTVGEIYYFDSVRVNLGLFQHDYNVIWDLAPHDLSIMLHLLDEVPVEVSAVGATPVDPGDRKLESIAYVTIRFASESIAHIHVNWLAPMKIRLTLIGGSSQMIVWNDLEPDTKVKIYDRGIETLDDAESIYHTLVQYRTGDMFAPKLDKTEALQKECVHFSRCIRSGEVPLTDGTMGRNVVALLEAAQRSLDAGGRSVAVELPDREVR